jgi:hypothetical protein
MIIITSARKYESVQFVARLSCSGVEPALVVDRWWR